MALHKDLTGAELHEPKGIETAAAGTVYVANGSGSGSWQDRYSGIPALNQYYLGNRMTDITAANNRVYFHVPTNSEIVSLVAVLDGTIAGTDNVLTMYVNGVAFPDTLTVATAGSAAGQPSTLLTSTPNTIPAGSIIEVRSNGASNDAVTAAFIQLGLRAKA